MMKYSDETLVAFIDGELPKETEAELIHALEDDSALQDRLTVLRSGDQNLTNLFNVLDEKPVRADTMALIDAAFTENRQETTDNVVAFKAREQKAEAFSGGWWQQAIAASIALVIGLSGGAVMFGSGESTDNEVPLYAAVGAVPQDSELHVLLSSQPSGETVEIEQNLFISNATFKSNAQVCRQFDLTVENTKTGNIACGSASGWIVVASAVTQSDPENNGYITASAGNTAMDAMLADMIEGDILTLEEEQETLKAVAAGK